MVDLDAAFVRYERIVSDTYKRIDALIQNGDVKPLLLWRALLPMVLPICALLIPCHKGGWLWRPVLQAVALSLSVDIILHQRALLGGNGYMVGLIMVWWSVWSSTLLFFNDTERDFRRIERVPSTSSRDSGKQNGSATKVDHRLVGKRHSESFLWVSYPSSLKHRLGWTLALVLNMRGPDFSFRISSLDPLPPQLDIKPKPVNERRARACPQAATRIRVAFVRFFVSYLVLDILKTIMIWDPYFLGSISTLPPPPLDRLCIVPDFIRAYRSVVSGTGVYFALLFVTALNPIVFLGLSTAFPNASRALTATPLDAPWLYADQFGPISAILDDGLAGAWGKWWHQIFRFGFVSTGKWVISFLPASLSSNRNIRRIITMLVAFTISGLIHGFGSYTQLGEENCPSGPFLFFALQAVGIFVQDIWCRLVVNSLFSHGVSLPPWFRRLGNVAFVLGWLFFSGTHIADDFATGGMWLTEPLPFSPIRGLLGQGWLIWKTPWLEHYDDGTYWGSGVRVL
ncbi:membrane bound O-acyl transferase family-domain-containing protein [Aspergillus unguis]